MVLTQEIFANVQKSSQNSVARYKQKKTEEIEREMPKYQY